MLIKSADDKTKSLDTLQNLLSRSDLTSKQKSAITKELNIMRAGIKGEKEAAYEIDFHYERRKNSILLHDIRLEVDGRVAQIDHMLVNRALEVFVFETKHFSSGIKINDDGEFLRWNYYKKTYEGMPSPIAQNQRHVAVLQDFLKKANMPVRLGMKLKTTIIPYVLVSNSARIDRSKIFDSSCVIKCDALVSTLDAHLKSLGVLETFAGISRVVSRETLQKIGRLLKYSHKPIEVDYLAKFGLNELKPQETINTKKKVTEPSVEYKTTPPVPATPKTKSTKHCSKCGGDNTFIQHGRYGYYFKCSDCDGNTGIKLSCVTTTCKPRIRKQALQFFKECATCNSSELYHENEAVVTTTSSSTN